MVDNLLKRGIRVRGAARSSKKADAMVASRKEFSTQLEFVDIEDIGIAGAFDEAVNGVNGIIHVASVSSGPPSKTRRRDQVDIM